jgi:hypothetical protein
VLINGLLFIALLSSHSLTAQAQTPTPAPAATASTTSAVPTKSESVEERITGLHDSLKITASQESDWKAVAGVMRANAATMEKLLTDKAAKDPATVTAVDDLKTYELFAQAHVTGLKKLITAFDTLYTAMPTAQRKIADQVFINARHERAAAHG